MPEFPGLPGQHDIGNPDNAFDAHESRVGRAIAESVYEILANEQSPHILPGMGTHFGAAENRIAIAVAQALKEKGLILAKAGVDVPRYSERICLDSNKIFYVDCNTSVAEGDGLSLSSPIKHLGHAIDMVRHKFDLNGYTVQLRLAHGIYGQVALHNLMLNGRLELIGTDTRQTRIESLFMENVVNDVYLKGVTLQSDSYFENCNTVTLENTAFKKFKLVQSRLRFKGSQVIRCDSDYPLDVQDGSLVRAIQAKFVFPEDLTGFAAFNRVINQSGIIYDGCLFVGKKQLTGFPFILQGSSFIKTGTNDLQHLPGVLSPILGTGCSYDQIVRESETVKEVQSCVNRIKEQVRSLRENQITTIQPASDYKAKVDALTEEIGECRLEIQKAIRQAGSGVQSFNLRKGEVKTKAGDYYADEIWFDPNDKVPISELIKDHADSIESLENSSKVTSFNERKGNVFPEEGDYTTDTVTHQGFPVRMALSQLHSSIEALKAFPGVTTFYDRSGRVMPMGGDYTADMIPVEDEDFNSLSGENVQEVLEDIDLEYELLYTRTNELLEKVERLTNFCSKNGDKAREALVKASETEVVIDNLEKRVDFLMKGFGMHEDDRLMRLQKDTTFVIGTETENKTLQAAVDFVYSEANLDGFTATIVNREDMSDHPTHIKGDPIGTGSLVISGSGLIGDIVLENCHQVIFDTCHFNGTVTVSDHSSVVFENCVFTAHAYNQLVVENHSFAELRGLTTCKPGGENTIIFGVAEHDSILSLENGSTLQVNDANSENTYFRLFGASFRSTLDLRAATIDMQREHKINLYSLSVLMGTQSLPPNLQVDLEPNQFCVALP